MKAPITTAQAMSHPDVALTINTLGKMADELRAALQERDAEIEELKSIAYSDDGDGGEGMKLFLQVRAQRKVLETALEALKSLWDQKPSHGLNGDAMSLKCINGVMDAITAIQEVLHEAPN